MALTAQLDIISPDGTIAGIGAIDPALWEANQGEFNAYAAVKGVSLIYYDTIGQYEAEFNANTVTEVESYITHYANLAYAKNKITPPTNTGGEIAGAAIAVAAIGGILWLLTR